MVGGGVFNQSRSEINMCVLDAGLETGTVRVWSRWR